MTALRAGRAMESRWSLERQTELEDDGLAPGTMISSIASSSSIGFSLELLSKEEHTRRLKQYEKCGGADPARGRECNQSGCADVQTT
jgi:hypothetical protein